MIWVLHSSMARKDKRSGLAGGGAAWQCTAAGQHTAFYCFLASMMTSEERLMFLLSGERQRGGKDVPGFISIGDLQ